MRYLLAELDDLKYLLNLTKENALARVKQHPCNGIILDSIPISSNDALRRAINHRIRELKRQIKDKGLAP